MHNTSNVEADDHIGFLSLLSAKIRKLWAQTYPNHIAENEDQTTYFQSSNSTHIYLTFKSSIPG